MKFVCNAFDPRQPNAYWDTLIARGYVMETNAKGLDNWAAGRVIGDPVPAKDGGLTSNDLRAMGLVGLYDAEETT